MKEINSNRVYKIVTIDREDVYIIEEVPLQDIIGKSKYSEEELNNDFFLDSELQYALQDVTDEILDLKLHERLHFKSDRGVENSLGIIIRIQ